MNKEYQKYIVSTPQHCTFLHRCSPESLETILQEGIVSGSELQSTTTFQPQTYTEAERYYENGKGYGSTAAVIQIPRMLWNAARTKAKGDEVATKEIGYFHPTKRDFTVRPEFIIGYIDRETNIYYPNHYTKRNPKEGYEAFSHLLG